MPTNISANITGDSKEAVALALLEKIVTHTEPTQTEEWLLDTYKRCIKVVGDASA